MAPVVVGYLIAVLRTAHLPSWPSVNTTSAAATMVFTTPSSTLATAGDASCDLWNAIGYGQAGK